MLRKNIANILDKTIERHPLLEITRKEIIQAFDLPCKTFETHHKLLIAGNGGSAADADHIVGELMKNFVIKRPLPDHLKQHLQRLNNIEAGQLLAKHLQPGLRAIALTNHNALNTAFANDEHPLLTFAQQIMGYGDAGDVFLGISTSGNSKNIIYAAIIAKAKGLKVIGVTGKSGGDLKQYCDVLINVNSDRTAAIQELHLPIYHTLCEMLEYQFFINE